MTNAKPWYKKWWAITLFILFGIIILASLGDNPNNSNTTTEQQENQLVAVFDLEGLYGKNIDEIKTILGTPSSDTEPRDLQVNATSEDQLAKEWDKTWEKDGYELFITYDVASRQVIDFFVPTNDPSGGTSNINTLREVVSAESLTNFTIEPVKAIKDPTLYTGIKIIPKK